MSVNRGGTFMGTRTDKQSQSLRFGGISPVVLRELSGVYQPFVKAVKEIISNSYDADAEQVLLRFSEGYRSLVIRDDGSGMNPIEFVRDYIRIGKSVTKDEYTSRKCRPRIGGKGIGFLAPARYCNRIQVRTKKNGASHGTIFAPVANARVDLEPYLLTGHHDPVILEYVKIKGIRGVDGRALQPVGQEGFVLTFDEPIDAVIVEYEFDSSQIVLTAVIDYELLFNIDPGQNLEEIEYFCTVNIEKTYDIFEMEKSYTEITLMELKGFVQEELSARTKRGARNVGSWSGIDQFLWNLSRIIPVRSECSENLPEAVAAHIREEIDGEGHGYPIDVVCVVEGEKPKHLKRAIVDPQWKMEMEFDCDLIRLLDFQEQGFEAHGFLVGQPATIYPAESRGVLLRVKGVAIGEPTFFDLDKLLTGPARVALFQISGEINITTGIDAIHDINPGRDGFYKESQAYNLLKKRLAGEGESKVVGILKELVDAILLRVDVKSSLENFIKKQESHQKAIFDMVGAFGELGHESPELLEAFHQELPAYELRLKPSVQYKAEGKLAAYSVKLIDGIRENYKVDFVNRELLLNKNSPLWRRDVHIAGQNFEINMKNAKNVKVFCEVSPKTKQIYINWDHPMRGMMGDAGFIKHCLAAVACNLSQDLLNQYVQLISHKV